jgi:hypothetical protein
MPNTRHDSDADILVSQARPGVLLQLAVHNDGIDLTEHQPHVPDAANALLDVRPQNTPPLVLVMNRGILNGRDESPDEAGMGANLPIHDGAHGARRVAV